MIATKRRPLGRPTTARTTHYFRAEVVVIVEPAISIVKIVIFAPIAISVQRTVVRVLALGRAAQNITEQQEGERAVEQHRSRWRRESAALAAAMLAKYMY